MKPIKKLKNQQLKPFCRRFHAESLQKEMDLSPFTLRDIRIYGRHLRFKSPRVLKPTLDESKQLLCLEDPDLGISASASLRSSLYEKVQQCVVFLWDEYAEADDSDLDEGAKALKRGLLEAIEEVESA